MLIVVGLRYHFTLVVVQDSGDDPCGTGVACELDTAGFVMGLPFAVGFIAIARLCGLWELEYCAYCSSEAGDDAAGAPDVVV